MSSLSTPRRSILPPAAMTASSLCKDYTLTRRTPSKFGRPVRALAIDPNYASDKARRFVSGGQAGQLLLSSKGWLGSMDRTIHTGEGPITVVRWRGSLIAWANEKGVKIYDIGAQQKLAFMERPKGSPATDIVPPQVLWQVHFPCQGFLNSSKLSSKILFEPDSTSMLRVPPLLVGAGKKVGRRSQHLRIAILTSASYLHVADYCCLADCCSASCLNRSVCPWL